MGIVRIEVSGSFPSMVNRTESAQVGGHAAALQRAIAALVDELPRAIRLDHELHAAGKHPGEAPFGESAT